MLRLLLIALAVALFVWLLSASYVFRLVIRDGKIAREGGRCPPALRDAFEDIGRRANLSGAVTLYPGGVLRFSRTIPGSERQRFRNVLSARPDRGL
jgi:hypothetical protein